MSRRRFDLWRTLRSPRLAAWLLAILAAFVLLGFAIPQRNALTAEEYAEWTASAPALSRLAASTGLDSAFTSPVFQLVVALLAVNLVACTLHRYLRRRTYPPTVGPGVPDDASAIPVPSDAAGRDPGAALGSPRGWRTHAPDEDTVVAWRGLWGWRGSMLMHVGLIVLVVGGLVSSLTRFSGLMVLTEGQTLPDLPDSYVSVSELPRYGRAFTGQPVGLEKVRFTYEGDTITAVVARMRGGAGQTRDVRVNYPLHHAGKAYLVEEAGHAVALRITDPGGAVVFESFVNLGEVLPDGSKDVIEFPGGSIEATLVSDVAARGSTNRRTYELGDPLLVLGLGGGTGEAPVELRPGEAGRVGEWLVEFEQARLWNRFLVRADRGRWISYLAFAFIVFGMALRWLDPDASVVVRRSEGRLYAWSRARYGSQAASSLAARVIAELRTETQGEVPA